MKFLGFKKTTLIDYPGKIACTLFTYGCNFRCHYCHNPELVIQDSSKSVDIDENEVIRFLENKIGKLDGVVITGGEPLLHEDLYDFLSKVKALGFLVKIDSNGTNFKYLRRLVVDGLADFVAMDIKAPLNKYFDIVNSNYSLDDIPKSIDFIKNNVINHEFRTTIVSELLTLDDLKSIAVWLKGSSSWVMQKFVSSKTINPKFINSKCYSDKELKKIAKFAQRYIKKVLIR